MLEHAALAFAGVAIGLVSALLGVGGGGFIVPLLVLGGYVGETKVAVGTSIAAVAFTSLSSSAGYLRDGAVDVRLGLLLMPSTVAGAYVGATASDVLPDDVLSVLFGIFLIYPGFKMAVDRETASRMEFDGLARGAQVALASGFGVVVGFSSGLFGIGGGSLMVPVLVLVLGLTMTRAVATSLFAMFPGAVVASARQWQQGNLVPDLALPLIAGVTVGAYLGPSTARHVPEATVRRAFGVLLVLLAARMVARGAL
ncbi:MAG: sulfite exporter TauE/SafE family protein [Halobacteriota archaeon]